MSYAQLDYINRMGSNMMHWYNHFDCNVWRAMHTKNACFVYYTNEELWCNRATKCFLKSEWNCLKLFRMITLWVMVYVFNISRYIKNLYWSTTHCARLNESKTILEETDFVKNIKNKMIKEKRKIKRNQIKVGKNLGRDG